MKEVNETALGIYEVLTTLHQPDDVFEIRIPKTVSHGTMAGYFNDFGMAAQAIRAVDGRVPSVYVTLNPVMPSLLSRCNNRLEGKVQITTVDAEIIKRIWLPFDFDPVRPAGISSTDEEHHAAQVKAADVKNWLAERGWPEPIVGDSGNGAHLLYRIDLPNDSAATITIQNVIRAVSAVFSDDKVQVDHSVFNAARIWKVYGTMSRKGDSTPDRPHRRAGMMAPIGGAQLVTFDQLEEIADMWIPDPGSNLATPGGGRIADIGDWVEKQGIQVIGGPHSLFQGKGKKWILANCPFNPTHLKPIVGVIEGRPVYKCLHQSCKDNHWAEFRAKVDSSYVDPDQLAYDMIRAYSLDEGSLLSAEYVSQLAKHSVGGYRRIRDRLISAGIRGLVRLDTAVASERNARLIEEGERNIPNNAYSLGVEIEALQSDGIIPVLWTDETSDRVWCQYAGETPELAKVESIAINVLMELHRRGASWAKKTMIMDVIINKAESNSRNMLKEWFEKFTWDRVNRVDTWLSRYFGCEDNEYTRAVGRKWLISAVARAFQPGCQVDHMLILEGAQGIGKSRAMRIVGGEFHVEYAGSLRSDADHKDMVHTIVGKSIVEISELSAFKGSSIERLKNMLTTTVDDVRLAYRRDSARYSRTCVFAGTTNEVQSAYISDNTGARRFWPVVCGNKIDNEALQNDINDIWGEAVNLYKAGEDWWTIPADVAEAEQDKRSTHIEDDFMFQRVIAGLTNKEYLEQGILSLTIGRNSEYSVVIAQPAIAFEVWADVGPSASKSAQQHLYNILRLLGFERGDVIAGKARRPWRYSAKLCQIPHFKEAFDEIIKNEVKRKYL